jgi:hypothetical protein
LVNVFDNDPRVKDGLSLTILLVGNLTVEKGDYFILEYKWKLNIIDFNQSEISSTSQYTQAIISKITSRGEVIIKFDKDLKLASNATLLNSSNIDIQIVDYE